MKRLLMLLLCIVIAALPAYADTVLKYAEQFEIEEQGDGILMITIAGTDHFLVVPEGVDAPNHQEEGTVVLQLPLERVYLAATSAMDLIRALDCVDRVTLSGTKENGWFIPEASEAMRLGKMRYAGKYSAPDFEMFLEDGCRLAIESTMIYHTPEVKTQIEEIGVPVLVERSSYESHPLGRMEWIKLYGVLFGKEEEANRIFDAQMARLEKVITSEKTGKTVAFFSVNSMGLVNVRKQNDYIVHVIELAGGEYALNSLEDEGNALSTMNIQMEDFYTQARNADYLIYNSTIEGELLSVDQIIAKNDLFADFKAVEEGHVFCTGQNLFQETMGIGQLILDINGMLNEADDSEFAYLQHLK